MTYNGKKIFIGEAARRQSGGQVDGGYCKLYGETYYKIANYDQMPPFFMSIVSVADHWLFISSTGGLTAGRMNAESALFPYYTDDKISENGGNTGHLAVFLVTRDKRRYLWEPFSELCGELYHVERNLYKNVTGDKLIFEEHNHDLQLTYRYAWRSGNRFGFVKTSWLANTSDNEQTVELLDGVQNILPYGASVALQTNLSNLLNAYKRSELVTNTGLGIFTLNATLTDLAEPSESLKATTVWQCGLEDPQVLLSSQQVVAFRHGEPLECEHEVRGYRGAYLANATLALAPDTTKSWHFVAEVNQDHAHLATLQNVLQRDSAEIIPALEDDIAAGSSALRGIVASADGLQFSADTLSANHHFANVLFNTMRGGIFADNYQIERDDLCSFIRQRNVAVYQRYQQVFSALPNKLEYGSLLSVASESGSADLQRLAYEYLPLTFSRRHGDPSRPWNKFSINISKPDGSQHLDYQGNWRDIFQNWEPLAWSYPVYIESMIAKFLNATTADGYNPYRITRDGIEWEVPDPHDPWANIGYWSDHQIVYLERLLKISRRFHPGALEALLTQRIFSHANVPYRIKPYDALLADGYNTIDFDQEADNEISALVASKGADGKLLHLADNNILHVNLAEKLLLLLLAKLGNFVPEGGVWMVTQRPEWNDANNALVGNGLSVVTLCHLHSYIVFFADLLSDWEGDSVELGEEIVRLFSTIWQALQANQTQLASGFSDAQRRQVMDQLGQASSDYRQQLYEDGLSGVLKQVNKQQMLDFLALAQRYIEQSLRVNQRNDHLFHSYNILSLTDDTAGGTASVDHLYEMLEGQVAILSTGLLSGEAALSLLQNLRQSKLYRADQHSYMLYPDRELPSFLEKNCVSAETLANSQLIKTLVANRNSDLMTLDENGVYHFNPHFRNAKDLETALDTLAQDERYTLLVERESAELLAIFEATFNHNAFTGRSGTFFAFEGLGSIYWHQVSKLLLAVQESAMRAIENKEDQATLNGLIEAYYDIRSGIGFNKSPDRYGAFPTDPYSHTPASQGAKQPGMTGQVKEEILTRFVELGISVDQGVVSFNPLMLRCEEFSNAAATFNYIAVDGTAKQCDLPANAIAFTYCQVPVIYQPADNPQIEIIFADGHSETQTGDMLSPSVSQHLFQRDGAVHQINVTVNETFLR